MEISSEVCRKALNGELSKWVAFGHVSRPDNRRLIARIGGHDRSGKTTLASLLRSDTPEHVRLRSNVNTNRCLYTIEEWHLVHQDG